MFTNTFPFTLCNAYIHMLRAHTDSFIADITCGNSCRWAANLATRCKLICLLAHVLRKCYSLQSLAVEPVISIYNLSFQHIATLSYLYMDSDCKAKVTVYFGSNRESEAFSEYMSLTYIHFSSA